jgi:hypothetical protein
MHCEAPASTSAFMTICFRKAQKTWFGSAMRDFTGGWCSRADRIRYNQLEKKAVLAAKLRFFSITSSSLTGEEAAALILSAVRAIFRLSRQHSSHGFIAKISRGPDVKIIEMGTRR